MAKHGKMHHMEIHKADNGGYMVEHHMHHEPTMDGHRISMMGPKVERHSFGPAGGEKMMEHIREHMGVKEEGGASKANEEE